MNGRDRFLTGIALRRATSATPLACLSGLRNVAPDDRSVELGFAAPPAGATRMATIDLAMLADLTLGAAARRAVGPDRSLPTFSIEIQLARLGGVADARVSASAMVPEDPYVIATSGAIFDGSALVGHCAAMFANSRGGRDPLPWELGAAPPPPATALEELTSDEQRALAIVEATDDSDSSWSERILRAACTFVGDGDHATIRCEPTPLLSNRLGGVQGGALIALAERSAHGLPDSGPLASIHVDFVSAARVGSPLIARSRVLRAARRTIASSTEIEQEGRLVAVATSLHRTVRD